MVATLTPAVQAGQEKAISTADQKQTTTTVILEAEAFRGYVGKLGSGLDGVSSADNHCRLGTVGGASVQFEPGGSKSDLGSWEEGEPNPAKEQFPRGRFQDTPGRSEDTFNSVQNQAVFSRRARNDFRTICGPFPGAPTAISPHRGGVS